MCKYSNELKQQVVQDYLAGVKVKDIQQTYNLPHGTVHSILRGAGVPSRRPWDQKRTCPKCGKVASEKTARFCCWCGSSILSEKDKIIETAEKLFPMCSFCPETTRDDVQQSIKDIISYIKLNTK